MSQIQSIRQAGIMILCFLSLLLTGCSTYKFNLHANKFINKNINNTASSTAVYIYQLKDIYGFNKASYKELINSTNNLNHSILSRIQVIILPDQNKTININVQPDAQFIGIVVGYRKLNKITWRQTYPIHKHFYNKLYHKSFSVHLTEKGVTLQEK